jgi:hypothetical protein
MSAPRHNQMVPEYSRISAGASRQSPASIDQLRAAVGVILAGTANLRHYRDRLTPDEHIVIVSDIEEATEQILRALPAETARAAPSKDNGRAS